MIEYVRGDLLKSGESIIVHGCNCFNTMGSGIAAQVREQFPYAWAADQLTIPGDETKLGKYTSTLASPHGKSIIINAYTQYGFTRDKVNADYSAIEAVFEKICVDFPNEPVISMPMIGAGLAGGDWIVIDEILKRVSDKHNKTFRVYIFTPPAPNAS